MNRKIKIGLFILLIALHILSLRYGNILKFNLDLLYLILVYIAIKSGFLKTIFAATAIGLITDFFSMQVMGVFGFSRTISGYLLNEISPHIDLKNNMLVFLLITLSLFISNLIANIFFHFISGFPFQLNLILYQPLFTGLIGILITGSRKAKQYLDVY
ncbi:MAG TPA: rod shape-determining protein MreD [Candidatus Deferrimicrobium sp.]|nr:rod shape-determining protein MreD [Candidatus Kapabacteria bacterium]HLP62330.1 rod shape-determining protein MreD [Candidatus Deferrimicrobium sp.]